jgi:hypothetical protein
MDRPLYGDQNSQVDVRFGSGSEDHGGITHLQRTIGTSDLRDDLMQGNGIAIPENKCCSNLFKL